MVQTFSDDDNIYSVDMMFAYLKIFYEPVHKIEVKDYLQTLEYKGWGDPSRNIFYSPSQVIQYYYGSQSSDENYSDSNNNNKLNTQLEGMFQNELLRIKNADLSFPIIIFNKNIVDGVHRLAKAVSEKREYIQAYVFRKHLMKKFLIDKKGDWKRVDNMEIYEIIALFYKRFRGYSLN